MINSVQRVFFLYPIIEMQIAVFWGCRLTLLWSIYSPYKVKTRKQTVMILGSSWIRQRRAKWLKEVQHSPLWRCGPARMLPAWTCWSCPAAVEVAGWSSGDSRSNPRWSYPGAPPHPTHSSLLRLCSRRSLLLSWSWHFLKQAGGEKRRYVEGGRDRVDQQRFNAGPLQVQTTSGSPAAEGSTVLIGYSVSAVCLQEVNSEGVQLNNELKLRVIRGSTDPADNICKGHI